MKIQKRKDRQLKRNINIQTNKQDSMAKKKKSIMNILKNKWYMRSVNI